MTDTTLTLIGGPTVLIDVGGLRLLTDPTFDAPGRYEGTVTLVKQSGPASPAASLGRLDAVLLSHDQHKDNLDEAGRALLPQVGQVLTTEAAVGRLGPGVRAHGLAPWQTVALPRPNGGMLHVTATPARHGPPGIEPISGDVIGFALGLDAPGDALYVTGDTVWFEGVAEVARRFRPRIVLVFAGAARTRGPFNLTMGTNDVLETAQAFPEALIVPVHTEGWAHFTETADDIAASFRALGYGDRLRRLMPGRPTRIACEAIQPPRQPDR